MALHHLRNRNLRGARTLLARSRACLDHYRPRHLGLDLDGFLAALEHSVGGVSTAKARRPRAGNLRRVVRRTSGLTSRRIARRHKVSLIVRGRCSGTLPGEAVRSMMSAHDEFSFSAAQFSGTTRLFPLPNLVLFPHVMQPLHVFEPRYRDLLAEALAADRLITMAILRPGWEADYEGRPPVFPVCCLGKVVVHHRLESGAFNLLLFGLCRVRLLDELPPSKSYREARAEICQDISTPEDALLGPSLQRRLREALERLLPHLPQAQEQVEQVLGTDISLGALTDIISYVLDIGLAAKERLLAEINVRRRAEMLLEHLSAAAAEKPRAPGPLSFLPDFSAN